MIYRILYNKQEIFGPTLDQAVLNPTLEIELNSAGKLEFTLPILRSTTEDNNGNKIYPDDIWNTIQVFRGEIEVWEEDDCIFYGRPLQIIRDWNNQKRVVCEGALSYFNDSIQPTKEYEMSNTVLYDSDDYPNSKGFFNKLIERHNDQLRKDDANSSTRHFKVGDIDIENSKIYRKTDYQTTAECLQSMCLDTDGGYFILRKEYDAETEDYVNVIDWKKTAPYGTSQEIQFGVNLLDITQDLNGSDLCTVLYPTAGDDIFVNHATKYTEENPYEVKDENNNVTGHIMHETGADRYITHIEGYKKYGRIVKIKSFDITEIDDSDPDYQHKNSQALFKKAAKWLNDQNQEEVTIECSAADLHYLTYNEEYSSKDKLRLGQMVQVIDDVHNVTRELPIYKISMNLDSGVKKITMGTPPKKELTDIVKTSTSSSTRGSSGTAGGGNSSTGGSGGSGSSVDIPVIDVKVKKTGDTKYKSVVDNKTAKIDLTDIGGTTVVANPSDTATADLSKIQIDDLIYGVATPTDIQTLQTNFQDGVDAIYDACVAKGSTPASQSLSDVVQGIMDIHTEASLGEKNITSNGTYNAEDDNYDGYSKVVVNVSGGGGDVSNDFSYEPIIPVMTSATAPSGQVSASSFFNNNFAPFRAFDDTPTVSTMQQGWLANASDIAPYISYTMDNLQKFSLILIKTANNSTTTVRNVIVEGLKSDDTWENCLKTGNSIELTFESNTYGDTCLSFVVALNGNQYKGIRISGNDKFYGGTNQYACTFDRIQVFSVIGDLPGIGYYDIGNPPSNLGENGNIYTDVFSKKVYSKQNGVWTII